MKHLGTVKLETERLVLRRFTIEDASYMYKNWASDPDVTKYLMWPPHESVSVSCEILREWTARYSDPAYYQWAIVCKELGAEPIGCIGVTAHDDRIGMAHIGYCIGKTWWHTGITSEALQCVIAFLMNQVGMQRIESRHDPRNPNSGAVMRKCKMQYEGTLRQADWNNQGICDAAYYSILKND